jgi:hypothetical protein
MIFFDKRCLVKVFLAAFFELLFWSFYDFLVFNDIKNVSLHNPQILNKTSIKILDESRKTWSENLYQMDYYYSITLALLRCFLILKLIDKVYQVKETIHDYINQKKSKLRQK